MCKELKPIYQAVDADAAERALERFRNTTMGKTINSIEGLNRAVRKVIKTRTLFPNEEAAKKLIYLAIMNFTASWKRATPKWSAAMPQFALLFGERFTGVME